MKRAQLVTALAVLGIAAATWLVVRWSDSDVVPPPAPREAPPAPIDATPAAPAMPPARAAPRTEVVVEGPDAGGPAREVRFTVRENGKSVVGDRLELTLDKRHISGTLNVMGEVVLPLEDGTWTVYHPGPTRPRTVVVGPGVEQVDLELLDFTVRGVVVNQKQEPVHGTVMSDAIRWGWGTDLQGRFIAGFDNDEPVTLRAESGTARSLPVRVRPPVKDLVLTVEEPVLLSVVTNSTAAAIVRHRGGFERCNVTPCDVWVLTGEVIASAVGPRGGVMRTARKAGQVSKTTRWDLTLAVPKPLRGVLVDAQGAPVPGATVRLEGVALTSDEFVAAGGKPRVLGSKSTGLTNRKGEFSVPWPDANELFFAVSTDAPISLDRLVYVVPGDGPLSLTAAP